MKTFFFDRDGVINKRIMGGYITKVSELEMLPEFYSIFSYVKKKGYFCVLVTNQQGIGKGLYTDKDLELVHNAMQEDLQQNTGFKFDAIYYCPNLAVDNAECRKPAPGMLLQAEKEHNIDFSQAWLLGDSISDVKAGKAVKCRTILIGDYKNNPPIEADYIFETHNDLVKYIDVNDFIE